MPRVLIYVTLPPTGEVRGGPRSMLLTAQNLSRFEPVFVVNRDGPLTTDIRAAGLRVDVLPTDRLLDGIRSASWTTRLWRIIWILRHDMAVIRLARQIDARIVHCQDPGETLTIGLAARLAGCKVVYHVRAAPRFSHLRSAKLLACVVATQIVCVSEGVRQAYLSGAPPVLRRLISRKAIFIPNGVDLKRVEVARTTISRRAARSALGLPDASLVLAVVGPLEPNKNQLDFLGRAARGLLDLSPAVLLLLVGSVRANADYAARCRRVADALDPTRVAFLDEIPYDRMPTLYRATDIVLIPSIAEGLPRVGLEAQAFGIPVVARRIPGTETVVLDGETGFFVEPDRLETFADAVRPLLDPDRRERMGEAAREYVRRNFDARSVARHLEEVYAALLNGRRA